MADERPRILVVDPDRVRASVIEDGLRDAGVTNITALTDMGQLMRGVVSIDPDVIFIDLGEPDRDALTSAFQVARAARRPVALFVKSADAQAIGEAVAAGVSAFVVDDLRKERIKPILDLAIERFNALHRLERELEETRSALAGRKTVERAKGVLMKSRGVTEEEAYALLRKAAMSQNRKIADVAESLILAAGLLD